MFTSSHSTVDQYLCVPVVVIGARSAELTASCEMAKHNIQSIVLEKSDKVSGISRTETDKGYRFDVGSHQFFTKVSKIEQFWCKILGNDFRERISRALPCNRMVWKLVSIAITLFLVCPLRHCCIVGNLLHQPMSLKPHGDSNTLHVDCQASGEECSKRATQSMAC